MKNILINKIITIFFFLTCFFNLYAKKAEKKTSKMSEFTINYNDVSIIEYIQFVSKICNINFIYNKEDLNFNVTIISKEPISKQSITSTLVQVLKIHDLYITEDNNNLIISKNPEVTALAPILTKDNKNAAPIITKIFPAKNLSLDTLIVILRPMMSKNAILEPLIDIRQLIISDITTNIEKISELIESLDSKENPLQIVSYKAKLTLSSTLINLTKQLMQPLIGTNPFIIVSQDATRQIHIVSTPFLVQKAQSILTTLDIPPQVEHITHENQQVFIYKPVYLNRKDLINTLKKINADFLKNILDNAQWVEDSHSFIFFGTPNSIAKLQDILIKIDAPRDKAKTHFNYSLYKLKYVSGDQVEDHLEKLAQQLREQDIIDPKLLNVIDTAKWVKETNSILLTGDPSAIKEVKNIIEQYDSTKKAEQIFIYSPKNTTINDLKNQLNNIAKTHLTDQSLINSIQTLKEIPSSNSIIFTANEQTLNKLKKIVDSLDVPQEGRIQGDFLMFTPKHASLEEFEEAIKDIEKNLKSSGLADSVLLASLDSMRIVPSNNSIIFTGDSQTLKKIQVLLNSIDIPSTTKGIQHLGKISFWVYKIQYSKPQQLISSLKSIANDLAKIDSSDKQFLNALKSLRYIKDTNSLIFTGTQEALQRLEPLVQKFDIAAEKGEVISTYFVYKPKYLPGKDLEKILRDFAENLKVTNIDNEPLFEALESMQWSENTKTLVFTGESTAIEEIKGLLETFDAPNQEHPSTHEISGLEDLGFLVYKLQYHQGGEIQEALRQIATDLKSVQNEAATKFKLIKSIDSLQWIKVTNSLLCTGDKETLAKLKELINNLDVPLKQVFIEVLIIETTLTNALTFGLEWGTKYQHKEKGVIGMGNFAPPSDSTQTSAFATKMNALNNTTTVQGSDLSFNNGFDLGIIGDILLHKGKSFLSLGSLLQALQSDTETSIIMSPKIVAQDGKTATLFSGQNIPYSGSVVQNTSQSTLQTTNLEYRDIGINLTITPILGNSDSVTLTIQLESSATPSTATNTIELGSVTGITTTKTTMSTAIHVANKNFVVLSGSVTDTKTRSKTGIPCLGGLPIIGAAFSKNNDSVAKDNIVIFLRPHIINSYKDIQNVTHTQEDTFREITGTPTLEKDYDEATELIKPIDYE